MDFVLASLGRNREKNHFVQNQIKAMEQIHQNKEMKFPQNPVKKQDMLMKNSNK
jgi:hypothetical protein